MLRVTINGQPAQCEPGQTILSGLRTAGVDVPTLCDDPRLAPMAWTSSTRPTALRRR